MTTVSGKDAAILAYLARHKRVSADRSSRLTANLKGEALSVAKALIGKRSSSKRASTTARALRRWADDNDAIVTSTVRRTK
jgi:hypothetical protein